MFTCPTVLFPHTLHFLPFLAVGLGLLQAELAFLAVEVVHVGTQFTLLCKGMLNKFESN